MGIPGAQNGDKPWICTWPGTILEVFIYPAQNNSFKPFPTGPFPSGPAPSSTATNTPLRQWPPVPTTLATSSSLPPNTNSASSSTASSGSAAPTASGYPPFGGDGDDWKPPVTPPPYPKVIKFEERRVPGAGATTASCRQVEIINDGQDYKPVIGPDNQPVEVLIVENKRDPPSVVTKDADKRWLYSSPNLDRRDLSTDQLSDCGCIWWFT
jgi:hypothetical protein